MLIKVKFTKEGTWCICSVIWYSKPTMLYVNSCPRHEFNSIFIEVMKAFRKRKMCMYGMYIYNIKKHTFQHHMHCSET